MLAYLQKLNLWLNRLMMIIGGIAVLALMGIATSNVLLRILGIPFHGAYELVGFCGAILIAFALGETQRRKEHVSVDLFTRKLPKSFLRVMEGIKYLVTAGFFFWVTWRMAVWGYHIGQSGELSETLKIIYHPFIYCVSLGFGILTWTLLIDFLTVFKVEKKSKPDESNL